MDVDVSLTGVTKRYGNQAVVRDSNFKLERGKWLSLVGPSGCGKTTTLRMVAGFIMPDEGTICIRGRDVTHAPPYRRNTGMVFQNYALFPHMTVGRNIGYGLVMRKRSSAEIEKRVNYALSLVQLSSFKDRYPRELSGGQQQRVALARAIAVEPDVLLLDEPLSNLDARLRDDLRAEMSELQSKVGMTTIYVTHDQEEALSMSNQIAVMNAGVIEQIGTPREIYDRPRTLFVADFIGKMNKLACTVEQADQERVSVACPSAGGSLRVARPESFQHGKGAKVTIAFRSDKVRLIEGPSAENAIHGTISSVSYLGRDTRLRLQLADGHHIEVSGSTSEYFGLEPGKSVQVTVRSEHLYVF